MDPTEGAVRLIAEAGSEVHIKGKYINQKRSYRITTITNIYPDNKGDLKRQRNE